MNNEAHRLKVLVVVTSLGAGGAEMMLLKLLPRFAVKYIEILVISLAPQGALGCELQDRGINVVYLNGDSRHGKVAMLRGLLRETKSFNPDLVQGWMVHGNLIALLSGWLARRPVIWCVRHSNLPLRTEGLSTVLLDRLLALLSRLPRAIVYNSLAGRKVHERIGYFAGRGQVIPNGFDTDLFVSNLAVRAAVRRDLTLGPETLLIGIVGRYHPLKDHATFLRAAGILIQSHPNVKFLLAGEGCTPENSDLHQIAADAGISDRILLVGTRRDIPELTAALDIATSSSSSSEGFANVIGEAMSCGVPCVVTDVGDSAHIVGNTGIVVPSRNPLALCAAWRRLIELGGEGRRHLGVLARRRIVEEYSIDRIVERFLELYKGVAYNEFPNN